MPRLARLRLKAMEHDPLGHEPPPSQPIAAQTNPGPSAGQPSGDQLSLQEVQRRGNNSEDDESKHLSPRARSALQLVLGVLERFFRMALFFQRNRNSPSPGLDLTNEQQQQQQQQQMEQRTHNGMFAGLRLMGDAEDQGGDTTSEGCFEPKTIEQDYPHPHQSIKDRALEFVREAQHVVHDPRDASAEAVGRIMGKEHYHTHPHAQTHVHTNAPPPVFEEIARPFKMVKGENLLEHMRQAGHTMRHPQDAAAETAGRIMGRDNPHPHDFYSSSNRHSASVESLQEVVVTQRPTHM